MVMNLDKSATPKTEVYQLYVNSNEMAPQMLVYQKMEEILQRMRHEDTGVPVRTVKSFTNKIPAVFTGSDLILWMTKNLDVDDQVEALHLAHLLASHGYLFPVNDHASVIRNDNTFYRFQTPYFWPSNNTSPENTDYAIYLFKRTLLHKSKESLTDFETQNFVLLRVMLERKWDFIAWQAETQSKMDKKREKMERKVLQSQERAFWDVHRPMPGCVNTTEVDIRKIRARQSKTKQYCVNRPGKRSNLLDSSNPIFVENTLDESSQKPSIETIKKDITSLKIRLERRNIKLSKIAEAYLFYYKQYVEYDPFFTQPECSNPWLTDSNELWENEPLLKEASVRRVKRWAFSLQEVLADPLGRQHFTRFLEKEFSYENLKFWEAVQNMKSLPFSQVQKCADEIWFEYLAPNASCPINVDSQSHELSRKNMNTPSRWTFDIAANHVYHLMKSDSYPRYIRSEMYKEFLSGSKKKASVKGIRSIVSFSSVKKEPSMTSVLE